MKEMQGKAWGKGATLGVSTCSLMQRLSQLSIFLCVGEGLWRLYDLGITDQLHGHWWLL